MGRMWDALPPESRSGRVRLLLPAAPTPAPGACGGDAHTLAAPAGVVHLAATGDQSFDRRTRLALPLLQQVGRGWLHLPGAGEAEGGAAGRASAQSFAACLLNCPCCSAHLHAPLPLPPP